MFLSPVVITLMLFIASLVAVSGFYLIHMLVDHLSANTPASDAAADLTYAPISE